MSFGSARARWGNLQRSPRLPSCIETGGAYKPKMHQYHLAAGLRPDPLEKLTGPPDSLAALRALPDKAFSDKKAPNVVWRSGSACTRWGSLQRSPTLPSCIETPRAFGAPSSVHTAPRLTPSAFEDRAFRFSFFPIQTLSRAV